MKVKRTKLLVAGIFSCITAVLFISLIAISSMYLFVPAFQSYIDSSLENVISSDSSMVALIFMIFIFSGWPFIISMSVVTALSIAVAIDLIKKSKLSDTKYDLTAGLLIDLIISFLLCNFVSIVFIIIQMIDDDKKRNVVVGTSEQNGKDIEQKIDNLKTLRLRGNITEEQYAKELSRIIENIKQ